MMGNRSSWSRDLRRGFTLTSTAVAAGLLGLVILLGFGILVFGQRRTGRANAEADLQQQGMTFIYRIIREVNEAREILAPLRAGRRYPFLALKTIDQELVLYSYQEAQSSIVRQVIEPGTWQATRKDVVCKDVDDAGWGVSRQGQLVHLSMVLARELKDRRVTLPLVTGIGVRSW